MMLQWTRMDIGYPSFLKFQRDIFVHLAACEADSALYRAVVYQVQAERIH